MKIFKSMILKERLKELDLPRIFIPLTRSVWQEGLDSLLRSLLALCFHSSTCNTGYLTSLYSSKSQFVDVIAETSLEMS